MPVSLRKPIYGFPKLRDLHLAHDRSGRVRTTLVLDELPKLRGTFIRGERLVEAGGSIRHGVLELPDVLHAPSEPLGHRPLYGLTYPPSSIGREPKAPVGVELPNRRHKTDVALLDQILEGQTTPTRLLGYRDNKPQVLLYESLAGSLITHLSPLGEVYLLLVGQERALADSS